MPRRRPPLPPKNCEQCNAPFIPTRKWQLYCGVDCRQMAFYKSRALLSTIPNVEGVSPAQRAEWNRRKNEAIKQREEETVEIEIESDIEHKKYAIELARKAEPLIPTRTLEDIMRDLEPDPPAAASWPKKD